MRLSVTTTLAITLVACAPSAISAPTDTHAVYERLRACNLATTGELRPQLLAGLYLPDACYADCYAAAACDELQATLCDTSIALRLRCDARCAHDCGDGALVSLEAVCNGANNCADGSDEAGCAQFTCGDGAHVPSRAVCDGAVQCPDRSDEAGCPGWCMSGREWGSQQLYVGTYYHCDGYPQCWDAADEAGCATFRCPAGNLLTYDPARPLRCDGYAQCSDGADEAGCPASAALTPRCPM